MSKKEVLAGLLLSALLVAVVGLLTNELDTNEYAWDHNFYIHVAENGFQEGDALLAPYAYRFLGPLCVRSLTSTLGLSTPVAFSVIAYLGTLGQLFSIVLLSKLLGFTFRSTVVVLLTVAFSLFNVKFLLFDVYRPDHLAFPLLVLSMAALVKRRPAIVLIVTVIGLQTREFLLIPGALCLLQLYVTACRERSIKALLQAVFFMAALSAAVVLPRVFIPVVGSVQFIDPVHNPDSLSKLLTTPFKLRRDFNLGFVTVAYMLPLILLTTKSRMVHAMKRARSILSLLVIYGFGVFLLSLYGGTDLGRFAAYLVVPQVIILGYMLEKEIHIVEAAYMLCAVFVFNRIALDIPNADVAAYLDFYGGHASRVNASSYLRIAELAAYSVGAVLLRMLLKRRDGLRVTADAATEARA